MNPAVKWNIILVGESGVGKTSMVQRYVHGKFPNVEPTLGIEHAFRDIEVEGTIIRLVIWDSAGQEIYKSTVPQYFRKADGCILVYDVTVLPTFNKLSGWLSEFRTSNEKAPVILAGNKNEDPKRKSVSVSVVQSYAQQESMEYLECSAKTGENVQEAFELLIEKLWDCHMESRHQTPNSAEVEDSFAGAASNQNDNLITVRGKSSDFSRKVTYFEHKPDFPKRLTAHRPEQKADCSIRLTAPRPSANEEKKKGCCS